MESVGEALRSVSTGDANVNALGRLTTLAESRVISGYGVNYTRPQGVKAKPSQPNVTRRRARRAAPDIQPPSFLRQRVLEGVFCSSHGRLAVVHVREMAPPAS
jgi:hypothetical protein